MDGVDDDVLKDFYPFNSLSKEIQKKIVDNLTELRVLPYTLLFKAGDQASEVFLVKAGSVEFTDAQMRSLHLGTINAGSYFGERAVLFDSVRRKSARCGPQGAHLYAMPDYVFTEILRAHENMFALGLADALRYKQDIFREFRAFRSEILAALSGKKLDLKAAVELYKELSPAIHKGLDNPHVDFDGWVYSIRRLPENITSVFTLVLSHRVLNVLRTHSLDHPTAKAITVGNPSLPLEVKLEELQYVVSAETPGRRIATKDRRRTCWEVMPGKLFVLIRDGVEDYIDFITNLLLHLIESQKLRRQLKPLDEVMPFLQMGVQGIKNGGNAEKLEREVFSQLISMGRITLKDASGLAKIWPNGKALENVYNICIHHGDYDVHVDEVREEYNVMGSEKWMLRVRGETEKFIGRIDENMVVDIISSNTYSVLNLLSPYVHQKKDILIEWARKKMPELFTQNKEINDDDRLYVIADRYIQEFPEERVAKMEVELAHGIKTLEEREVTGISVQLIDVMKLKSSFSGFPDEFLKTAWNDYKFDSKCKLRHLIVNIDFAFGGQASRILKLLVMIFGQTIRSINVLGKAGGLCGKRGDILFPTHIIDEDRDGELRCVDNKDIGPEDLVELSHRQVHVGPILTISGTLMQNMYLLTFYEKLWHVIGLEMEGNHYLKTIDHCMMLGLLKPNVKSRFVYYTSDTPNARDSSATLSKDLSIFELVPPLYAISRVITAKCLQCPELCHLRLPHESLIREFRKVRRESVDSASVTLRRQASLDQAPSSPEDSNAKKRKL